MSRRGEPLVSGEHFVHGEAMFRTHTVGAGGRESWWVCLTTVSNRIPILCSEARPAFRIVNYAYAAQNAKDRRRLRSWRI